MLWPRSLETLAKVAVVLDDVSAFSRHGPNPEAPPLMLTKILALGLFVLPIASPVLSEPAPQPSDPELRAMIASEPALRAAFAAHPESLARIERLWPSVSRKIGPLPLYDGAIPNSKPAPDEEKREEILGRENVRLVSVPTYTLYLPAPDRASGAAVAIFPGGGYVSLAWSFEGTAIAEALQDRGIAAALVKYRLPSDATMVDKSIGPLQDAQQAVLQIRRHARAWRIDPDKVGVIGFSAGGHLASTVGTHFDSAVVPDPDHLSVRPDFMILVYPVITMADKNGSDVAQAHRGSRDALLGSQPTPAQIRRFSNELQVTSRTPPAMLLAAEDDTVVDIDNSIGFYEALRRNGVPAELVLFPRGEHGFVALPRHEWMAPMWAWLGKNGWIKP